MARVASELASSRGPSRRPGSAPALRCWPSGPAEEGWDHETYLAAVLAEEVTARETHGGQHRVKAARFSQVKTLDDFDFTFQPSVKRQTIAHLWRCQSPHPAVSGIPRQLAARAVLRHLNRYPR